LPQVRSAAEGIAGLSLKTVLITLIGLFLFGIYVKVLINGENSYVVLDRLHKKKIFLEQQEIRLKSENQRLQKELFELKQLEPKEQE